MENVSVKEQSTEELDSLKARVRDLEAKLVESRNEAGYIKTIQTLLFDNDLIGIAHVSKKLKFTSVNSTWTEIFGTTEENIINSDDVREVFDLSKNKGKENLIKLFEGKNESYKLNKKFVRHDKSIFFGELSVYPLRDKTGDITSFYGFLRVLDNSERSDLILKNQNEFLHVMMNNIPNPVYYKNKRGIYLGCNQAFQTWMGRPIAEIFGRSVFDFMPTEVAVQEYKNDLEVVKKESSISFEITYPDSSGQIRDVIFNKSTFYNLDGSVGGVVGVMVDITERKKAETELLISESQLKHANATKNKFFSIISHNLRNPFSTMLGFSDMLLDDYDEFGEDERKSFVVEIQKSAKYAYGLLENLLYWSRLQTNQIQFKPEKISLDDLVNDLVIKNTLESNKRKINLISQIEDGVFAYGDESMISLVLQNLISNALKFTGEEGDIKIYSKTKNDFVEITVEDSGIGLGAEDISKLFRIEIHATKIGGSKEKGTGLGLILCKDFVHKNGGEIRVESTPGQGSKFIFTMPSKNLEV